MKHAFVSHKAWMIYKNIHSFGGTISDGWIGAASTVKQNSQKTQSLFHLNRFDASMPCGYHGEECPRKETKLKLALLFQQCNSPSFGKAPHLPIKCILGGFIYNLKVRLVVIN